MKAAIRPIGHFLRCTEIPLTIATPNMVPTKGFKASRKARLAAVKTPERSPATVKTMIEEKRRELLVIAVPLDIVASPKAHKLLLFSGLYILLRDETACQGKQVIIARGTERVVRLVPIVDSKGHRNPGALRGKLRVGSEFFEPLADEELAGWK